MSHLWIVSYSHVSHDSFTSGTWLIHIWDMTNEYFLNTTRSLCHMTVSMCVLHVRICACVKVSVFVRMCVCVCVCVCGSKRESKRGQRERARDVKEREHERGSTSLEHVFMDASITKRGKDLSFINFIKGTSEVAQTQKNKKQSEFLAIHQINWGHVRGSQPLLFFYQVCVAVCCSVLHYVAVWCSMLQCGAVCWCVAVCCSV